MGVMSEAKKAEQDERVAFEAHIRNECDDAGYADMILRTNAHGFYHVTRIQGAWEGWQARAASTSANAGHASLMGIVADGDGNILNATVKYREVETFMAPIAETSSNVAQGAVAVREQIARALHYPACWDTAAYPTLDSAAWEAIACAKLGCSTCGEPK
jgi:hypothetical protein